MGVGVDWAGLQLLLTAVGSAPCRTQGPVWPAVASRPQHSWGVGPPGWGTVTLSSITCEQYWRLAASKWEKELDYSLQLPPPPKVPTDVNKDQGTYLLCLLCCARSPWGRQDLHRVETRSQKRNRKKAVSVAENRGASEPSLRLDVCGLWSTEGQHGGKDRGQRPGLRGAEGSVPRTLP